MMIGAKDRCDYRTYSDKGLIEEAKYTPNTELCIVLAERLEKIMRKVDDYRYDVDAERHDYDSQF